MTVGERIAVYPSNEALADLRGKQATVMSVWQDERRAPRVPGYVSLTPDEITVVTPKATVRFDDGLALTFPLDGDLVRWEHLA